MGKTLCLYYSITGNTEKIMREIASGTGADIAVYTDGFDRSGFFGYIKTCIDCLRRPPKVSLVPAETDLGNYDRVIIGMPVWAEMPAVTAKGFLSSYAGELPDKVYLVVTHMAKTGYEKQIMKLDSLLRTPHTAHLSVCTKDHDWTDEVKAFTELLNREAEDK